MLMREDDTEESGLSAEPIRRLEDVAQIRALLAGRPRDQLLFSLGVNNSLRAGDLLRVTVNQVRSLREGEAGLVRVKRTGALAPLTVTSSAHEALRRHLSELQPPRPPRDMYLFASHPGWSPLTTQRLGELVAEWTRTAGLDGRFGADSLRKTFGYIQRTRFGVDPAILARLFGHASPEVTLRYLGLNGDPGAGVVLQEL